LLIPAREYDWPTSSLLSKPRRLLGVLAVFVAVAVGLAVWLLAGGDSTNAQPKEDPVAFLDGIVRGIVANDYGRVWQSLHPAQQRVAKRDAYIACEHRTQIAARLDWIKPLRAVNQQISVAGDGGGPVQSKAVTFELKLVGEQQPFPVTVHAIAVDGRWRWILTPRRFETYRSGACPQAEPASPSA
jgi:hypothetical protein